MQRTTYFFLMVTFITLIQPAQAMQQTGITPFSGKKSSNQTKLSKKALKKNQRRCGMDKKEATFMTLLCCYGVPTVAAVCYCPWPTIANMTSEMYTRDPDLCCLMGSSAAAVSPLACLLPYGCAKECIKDFFPSSQEKRS